ncbi:MAG: AtpZ/AtpI family protein [Gemmatimonadetes bacterium]|nr:AtpZ/AtpI family protein [Gemmatimonadota bacterium]MCH8938797.1 AtpZ/AtpI family protein [Gemmatimonadota bacterium]
MEYKRSQRGRIGEGYKLVGLGGTLAAAIIVFMLGGFALDGWLGLTPLFTLVGTAVGATLGFVNVYWKVQAEIDREKKSAEKKSSN